jgi:hypothetical protein
MIFSSLTFGRSLLLARDGLARSFTGARIGMRALAANRQVLPMPQTAIGPHIEMAFDVHRDLTPEIAFDFAALIDGLADFDDVVIGKVIALQIKGNSRVSQDLPRGLPTDTVNIGERHFYPFGPGQIDSGYTRHNFTSLAGR